MLIVVFAVVVGLLAAKVLILKAVPNRWAMLLAFCLLLLPSTSILHTFDNGYNEGFVSEKSHFVGLPVATLAVPTLSFFWDWLRRPLKLTRAFAVRSAVEVLMLNPAWWVTRLCFECFVLHWTELNL